jgi:hypothetical protein
MWQCSQKHDNREEAKFCAKCGEKRVERIVCSACGTVLEPTDEFCIACGCKVAQEPAPRPVVDLPPPAPTGAPPPPPPAAAAKPDVTPTVEPPIPASEPAKEEETFSFSFGGTTVGAKTPVKKVKQSKSPMATGVISFVVLGILLLVALYLMSR